MALATRCPHCQTTFRVASDQLKLRGGIVRCGTCQQVFDGNAALVDPELPLPAPGFKPEPEPDTTPEKLAEPDLDFAPAPDEPAEDIRYEPAPVPDFIAAPDPDFDREPEPEPEDDYLSAPEDEYIDAPQPEEAPQLPKPGYVLDFDLSEPAEEDDALFELAPAEPEQLAPDPDHELDDDDYGADPDVNELSVAEAPDTSFTSDIQGQSSALDIEHGPLPLLRQSAVEAPPEPEPLIVKPAPEPPPEPDDEPEFVRLARAQELAARRRRIVMGCGSALLVLILLVQGLTTFRNVLVAAFPGLKPMVAAGCAILRCKIELPAQIEALSIEKGELQSLGPNTFEYTTVLRNESRLTQTWPHIELELNDADDKALVRRVFTPVQYLPSSVTPARGFAGGSEQAVKIHFELKQLTASGYRIAVFYP